MDSPSIVASTLNSPLLRTCPHLLPSPTKYWLRLCDARWLEDATYRSNIRALKAMLMGYMPSPMMEGFMIAGQMKHRLPPIAEEEEIQDPAHNGAPQELLVNCDDHHTVHTYGPTSFTGHSCACIESQLSVWKMNIAANPYPTVMLTAIGHFLDSHSTIPGVRVGSDVRAYQHMSSMVHRIAVLSFVGSAQDFFYALVFIYGDEYGDGSAVSEKVGILRMHEGLVGPSVLDPAYKDDFHLVAKKHDWAFFHERNNVDVFLALPSSHPRPAFEFDSYDVPHDTRLDNHLRIEDSKLLSRGIVA